MNNINSYLEVIANRKTIYFVSEDRGGGGGAPDSILLTPDDAVGHFVAQGTPESFLCSRKKKILGIAQLCSVNSSGSKSTRIERPLVHRGS